MFVEGPAGDFWAFEDPRTATNPSGEIAADNLRSGGNHSAVASGLAIPNLSSPPTTSSSVPVRPSRIDPSPIAKFVPQLEEAGDPRGQSLSKAVDNVVDSFELDEDLLDLLVAGRLS